MCICPPQEPTAAPLRRMPPSPATSMGLAVQPTLPMLPPLSAIALRDMPQGPNRCALPARRAGAKLAPASTSHAVSSDESPRGHIASLAPSVQPDARPLFAGALIGRKCFTRVWYPGHDRGREKMMVNGVWHPPPGPASNPHTDKPCKFESLPSLENGGWPPECSDALVCTGQCSNGSTPALGIAPTVSCSGGQWTPVTGSCVNGSSAGDY
jgi:hypothetical protein